MMIASTQTQQSESSRLPVKQLSYILQPLQQHLRITPLLLPPGGQSTIGTLKNCSLVLENTAGVKPIHCVISTEDGLPKLLECDAQTWLNDQPITQAVNLRLGDTLAIGAAEFRLRAPTTEEETYLKTAPSPDEVERASELPAAELTEESTPNDVPPEETEKFVALKNITEELHQMQADSISGEELMDPQAAKTSLVSLMDALQGDAEDSLEISRQIAQLLQGLQLSYAKLSKQREEFRAEQILKREELTQKEKKVTEEATALREAMQKQEEEFQQEMETVLQARTAELENEYEEKRKELETRETTLHCESDDLRDWEANLRKRQEQLDKLSAELTASEEFTRHRSDYLAKEQARLEKIALQLRRQQILIEQQQPGNTPVRSTARNAELFSHAEKLRQETSEN